MGFEAFKFVQLPCMLVILVACASALPSFAAPATPSQQSICEIQANRFEAQHPHVPTFDYMNFGFFPFGKATPPKPPLPYRDSITGITVYVESDGRHVAAIDGRGSLLWVRDPFVESNMCPYRSAHPYIDWIGPPGGCIGGNCLGAFTPTADAKADASLVKELNNEIAHGRSGIRRLKDGARFIGISFNSSQYGFLNIANGDFYEMGQN